MERFDDRRKQAVQAENFAFGLRERRTFVKSRIVEQDHAAHTDSANDIPLGDVVRWHSSGIVSFRRLGALARGPG